MVEPSSSRCLYESAQAGRVVKVAAAKSVMDGLVVEEASAAAWGMLHAGAFAFLAVPDRAAIDAMRVAAEPVGDDPPAVIGDTGSAGWAGFMASVGDLQLRRRLQLTDRSRVVVVVTEGATDPGVYREIVGKDPDTVLAGR